MDFNRRWFFWLLFSPICWVCVTCRWHMFRIFSALGSLFFFSVPSQSSLPNWAFSFLAQQLELFPADLWLLFLRSCCWKIHPFSLFCPDTSLILVLCAIPLFPLLLQKRKTQKQLQPSCLVFITSLLCIIFCFFFHLLLHSSSSSWPHAKPAQLA